MGTHNKPQFRKAAICACGLHGFVGLTTASVSLFSPEDLHMVAGKNWCTLNGGGGKIYARCADMSGLMHRIITGADKGQVTDHRSGDTLDNQRGNIRVCTQAENTKNKSHHRNGGKFKGITQAANGIWRAYICTDGDRQCLGKFTSDAEAAAAYDAAALRLHGEFARTNKMMGLLA